LRFWTLPRKPHQQTSPYLRNEQQPTVVNIPYFSLHLCSNGKGKKNASLSPFINPVYYFSLCKSAGMCVFFY
ncbi:MAG: hypothetical protein ACE5MK_03230, partial [Acidobacteriota bacterium]